MLTLKNIRYKLEYFIFKYCLFIFANLPLQLSRNIASLIICGLSFLFKADKLARRNLKMIFPHLSAKEINHIKRKAWSNLGKNFAEHAYFSEQKLDKIDSYVNIKGLEYLELLKEKSEPVIFFTAHYSNWELANLILAIKGFNMNSIYRPANNHYIDKEVAISRVKNLNITLHKKGKRGSVAFLKALIKGESGGILIDQKYRTGLKVDFLGKTASSSSLIVEIAKKYKAIMVPVHIERLSDGKFDFIVQKPIEHNEIKDKTTKEILSKLNEIIGKWILNKPGEWFWVHDRWG